MKASLILLLPALFLLVQCSLTQDRKDRYRYVVAQSGIRLREAPATDSRSAAVIPYLSRVETTGKTAAASTIDGITDHWYRTEWSKTEGWIFGGYTRKKTEEERIFYFYRHVPYDCGMIAHPPAFELSKTWGTKKDAAFGDFAELPSLIPGDDVLVLTAEGSHAGRITKMDINYSELATYLSFETESVIPEDALCIGRAALEKKYGEQPIVTPLTQLPGKDAERFVIGHPESIKIGFSDSAEERAAAVSTNYTVETFTLGAKADYTVIVIKNRNRKESYTDGFIVMRKETILHSSNGRILCSFRLGNTQHLAVEEWIPYTGCSGMQVIKLDGDRAVSVEEDHIFSN